MTVKGASLLILLMFAAMMAYALVVYPSLPDRIPVHWNIRGEIDGWGPKTMVFLGPALILFGFALLRGLPALSPKRFRIDSFLPTFNYLMVIVSGLFAFIAFVIIRAAQHEQMDVGRTITVGISLFLAMIGNLLGKTRRNFFVGVRTPWTLASDKVWISTHRLAGRLLVGAGMLSALLGVAGINPMVCFALIMVAALYPVLFSFLEYKRLERTGDI